MAKLTKNETKLHQQALDLIHSDKVLTFDECEFIFDNYCGDAIGSTGAFFTPNMFSWDFAIDAGNTGSCLELCAGIGRLSFSIYHRYKPERLVCVELNPEYVEIGKRVLPQAEWVCSDVFQYTSSERFDCVYGNPPFGKVKTSDDYVGSYTGSEFEYKVIQYGSAFSDYGVWIVPQGSAGFVYSGARYYERRESSKYKKMAKDTGYVFEAGCGIDTSIYKDEWHGTSVVCEVVCVDYTGEDY
ncbi:methyltransferase [Salmonella enterica subsp. enterica serovar Kentucky]|nr:methyltransferase [Salmonella enterica subsp. enterica serovar Kentucky]